MRQVILLISILFILAINIPAQRIPDVDRTRIAEVYRIGERLEDRLWPGWSSAPFSMLFITDDHEFLIRHPKPNDEFTSIGFDKLLNSDVFVRPRKFQKNFLATFPAFGRGPVIVIGKAENTSDKTSSRWVFVALHEHFHQLQYSQPTYYADVNLLDLHKGDATGMWQINYPFPYKKVEVATKFRELANKLSAAYEDSSKLNEYLKARSDFASMLSANDYKYASFQLWQEGIARYTQFKMAELAARELEPSKSFKSLPDFTSFDTEARRILKMTTDEMRTLDLAKWERTVFYPVGAIEGLVLDRVDPNWRQRYFSDKFALEKFYGNRTASP